MSLTYNDLILPAQEDDDIMLNSARTNGSAGDWVWFTIFDVLAKIVKVHLDSVTDTWYYELETEDGQNLGRHHAFSCVITSRV